MEVAVVVLVLAVVVVLVLVLVVAEMQITNVISACTFSTARSASMPTHDAMQMIWPWRCSCSRITCTQS